MAIDGGDTQDEAHGSADDVVALEVTPEEQRRSRAPWIVGGVIAVVVIAVAGLVATEVLGDDGNDSAADSSDVETAETDATAEEEPDDEAGDDSGDGSEDEGAVSSAAVSAFATTVSGVGGIGEYGQSYIVPWGDGFVSLGVVYEPVLLEDIAGDYQELFPAEVVEAVQSSGAQSVTEAQSVLAEAGLLEATMEVLEANPDIMSAVTAAPVGRFEIWHSDDGTEWSQVADGDTPEGADNLMAVSSNGSQIAVAAQIYDYSGEDAAGPAASRVIVSVTSDLTSWETFELPISAAADLPDVVRSDIWVSGLAAGPNGWVATTETHSYVDEWQLLPEEVRNLNGGWGTSTSETGIQVEVYAEPVFIYDEDGNIVGEDYPSECCEEPIEEYFFTWEELGVDADIYDQYMGQPGSAQAWSAAWGDSPQSVDLGGDGYGSQIVATSAGFLAHVWGESPSPQLSFSADGRSWASIEGPSSDGWIQSLTAVENGVLLISSDEQGPEVWLGNASGSDWQSVAVPSIPADVQFNFYGGPTTGGEGLAAVVDLQPPMPSFEVNEISYEHNGFLVTESNAGTDAGWESSILIVDVASGETVLEASLAQDYDDEAWAEPDWVNYDDPSGITYINPDSGEAIVTVPHEVSGDAWDQAYEDAMVAAGMDPAGMYEYNPDLWLVATSDGIDWLVEDLPDPDSQFDYYPQMAAINGDVVIVSANGSWTRYTLG